MKLTIDTSVAVKLVLFEEGSDRALNLVGSDAVLLAPELIHVEMAGALWANVLSKRLQPEQAQLLNSRWQGLFGQFYPVADLAEDALRFALETGHAVYDCFFLALAMQQDAPLVTADARFLNVLRGTRFERHARPL